MHRSHFYHSQYSLLKLTGNRGEVPAKDNSHITSSQIFIIRNEPFEPYLEHAITCASLIGVNLHLNYSEYDDSLAFTHIPEDSDYGVLWLNWERIQQLAVDRFFAFDSPIATWATNSKMFFVLPSEFGTHSVKEFEIALETLGWTKDRIIQGINSENPENRRMKLGYTREELDSISSKVGLNVTSNDLSIKIRALILDLDNTMYRGVFGEDSFSDLYLEPMHVKLHTELKRLKNSGVLLCIASKNNNEDIDSIFSSNLMTQLSKDDFAVIAGGWASKSASIRKVLSDLNFDERYVAFIDDNKRELYEVGSSFPNMICVDGSDPSSVLATFSLVLSFENGASPELATKRLADIQTSQTRTRIRKASADFDTLLIELETRVRSNLAIIPEDLIRASDLFRKTNQFNLTLNRTTVEDLNLPQTSRRVVLASLTDTISDSGPIAAMYFSVNDNSIEIIEFSISCRALGRDVEKYIFRSMLQSVNIDYMNHRVFVKFRTGPKNRPASQFLERYFISGPDSQTLNVDRLITETSKWYSELCES